MQNYNMMINKPPIFVIGAGRSGTNLIAEILCADARFWNLYENRYIWNFGAQRLDHDVRTSEDATEKVTKYIRSFFEKNEIRHKRTMVDKTPSNVFRVDFAHTVLPEARFVNVLRDGRDNVVSRRVEWYGGRSSCRLNGGRQKGSAEGYTIRYAHFKRRLHHLVALAKRGNLPPERWPVFLRDNLPQYFYTTVTRQPARWGERPPGMKEMLRVYGLLVTAGIQWRESVMHATQQGRALPPDKYIEIRYEDFLRQPELEWTRIADFIGVDAEGPSLDYIRSSVQQENYGKWREKLTRAELKKLEPHIRPTMEYLGYEWE